MKRSLPQTLREPHSREQARLSQDSRATSWRLDGAPSAVDRVDPNVAIDKAGYRLQVQALSEQDAIRLSTPLTYAA